MSFAYKSIINTILTQNQRYNMKEEQLKKKKDCVVTRWFS